MPGFDRTKRPGVRGDKLSRSNPGGDPIDPHLSRQLNLILRKAQKAAQDVAAVTSLKVGTTLNTGSVEARAKSSDIQITTQNGVILFDTGPRIKSLFGGGGGGGSGKVIEGHTFVVAPSNCKDIQRADYVLTGLDDGVILDQAIRALPGESGRIVLLEGDVCIGGGTQKTIFLSNSNIHLCGQGWSTRIFAHSTLPNNSVMVAFGDDAAMAIPTDCILSDLLLDGNRYDAVHNPSGNANTVFGCQVNNSGHTIRYVWFKGMGERNIFNNQASGTVLNDCRFDTQAVDNFGGGSMRVSRCFFNSSVFGCRVSADQTIVSDCVFSGASSGAAISGSECEISDCLFIDSAGVASGIGSVGAFLGANAMRFNGNFLVGCPGGAVFFGAENHTVIEDNYFLGCTSGLFGQLRSHVGNGQNGDHNVVRNNTFISDGIPDYPIVLASPGSGSLDGTILDTNLFIGAGTNVSGVSIVDQGTNTVYISQQLGTGGPVYFGGSSTTLLSLNTLKASSLLTRYEPVTDGVVASPSILFDSLANVILAEVPN